MYLWDQELEVELHLKRKRPIISLSLCRLCKIRVTALLSF
jgi:hypothetical protein